MRIFNFLWLVSTIFGMTGNLSAQQASPCADDPYYQLMDFWLGDWQVYDTTGNQVGANHISSILNGCAVREEWEGSGDGRGESLFYVDNNSNRWKQIWVTTSARQPWGQKEKSMIYHSDSSLVFQGEYLVGEARTLDRTILKKISQNEVEQVIEVSQDGGQSWRQTFIGIYKRVLKNGN